MKRYLAVFLLPFLGALTPAQEYPQLVTSTEGSAPIRVDRGEASQEDHQQPPLDVLHPERQIKRRPRIALVLEGGGALGLAHLGVLSWFEQHHIPIDYIAGTSMGGLVGGLYATGNDPDQIHSFLRTVNWNAALNNNLPYSDLAFRRKEDARIYPPNLEFGFRGRSGVFASGFNSGHDVGLILDRVAYSYGDLRSFDDLPTPFRCVATDLVSGQPVVFDHGPLADALRATMSLPAIFSPVRRDGKILVDGGLLANLPVDVARRMGADVVIAVNLQTKPLEADASLSAFAVLQRSISVVIAVNELESMRRADLIIQVRTQDYTSTDYHAIEKLIESGFQGAEERSAVLSRFALGDVEWKEFIADRAGRSRRPPVPEFIQVAGADPHVAKAIEKSVSADLNKPLNYERMNERLTEIVGLGRFSRAGFQLIQKDTKPGLLVHADEKEYGSPVIRPVLLVDGSDYDNMRLSIGARVTFLDLGSYGSEWRNDVIAGSEYGISSEYYRPIGRLGGFFMAPRLFANDVPFDIYDSDARVASYRERRLGGGVDAGISFDRFSELRFGYELSDLRLTRKIGAPEFPDVSSRQGISRLLYRVDHTDDRSVPRQGYRLDASLKYFDTNLLANSGFPAVEVQSQFFHRLSRASSLFLLASAGTTFKYADVGIPPFSLGGPLRLSAYPTSSFLTRQYFLFNAGYIRRLNELMPLVGRNLYLIVDGEIGKAYFDIFPSNLPMDINGAIVAQTFFGAITLGGAVGDRGHKKVYFNVGRVF